MSTELGQQAGFEAIQNKQSLAPLLDAAVKARDTQPGAAMLGGLLGAICDTLDACQASGLVIEWRHAQAKAIAEALPAARRLLLAANCQKMDQDAADVLSSLATGLYLAREKINVKFETPAAKSDPAPLPMRVEIVSMPAREQQIDVLRSDGQIIGSRSKEADA